MNKFEPEEQAEEISVRSVSEENDAYIDYRKLNYKNTMPDNRVLVFLTGFCIGMVFFLFIGRTKRQCAGLARPRASGADAEFRGRRVGAF